MQREQRKFPSPFPEVQRPLASGSTVPGWVLQIGHPPFTPRGLMMLHIKHRLTWSLFFRRSALDDTPTRFHSLIHNSPLPSFRSSGVLSRPTEHLSQVLPAPKLAQLQLQHIPTSTKELVISSFLFSAYAKNRMEVQTNWHGVKFWHTQRISSVERGKLKEVNKTQEDMLWKREKPKFNFF